MPRITVRTTKIHDGDSKRELVRRLTSATVEAFRVTPGEVTVQLFEVEPDNWARGGDLLIDREPQAPR